MPTFVHGRNAALTFNALDVGAIGTDANHSRTADTAESSVFGTNDKEYVPGMRDETLSVTCRYDQTTLASLEALLGDGSAYSTVWGPLGSASGKPRYTFNGLLTDVSVSASTGDVVSVSVSIQRTGSTTIDTYP